MSKFSLVLCLVLAGCCVLSPSIGDYPQAPSMIPGSDRPRIVPLSDEEFQRGVERAQQPKDADKVGGLVVEALNSLGTKEVCLLVLGTDSVSPEPDSWRSCANVGNKQAFNIPEGYEVLVY